MIALIPFDRSDDMPLRYPRIVEHRCEPLEQAGARAEQRRASAFASSWVSTVSGTCGGEREQGDGTDE
jgi:hypothetical protein